MAFTHKVRIHTGQNRERDRDREEMGCMKLCESFHITPEPEHVPRPIVPHCSGTSPFSCLGPGYTIMPNTKEARTCISTTKFSEMFRCGSLSLGGFRQIQNLNCPFSHN